jgi:hypothetical protein
MISYTVGESPDLSVPGWVNVERVGGGDEMFCFFIRVTDLPALRDAIDAYLRPADALPLTPDAVERLRKRFAREIAIGGLSNRVVVEPDKDPLPEPSLRNEIADLRKQILAQEKRVESLENPPRTGVPITRTDLYVGYPGTPGPPCSYCGSVRGAYCCCEGKLGSYRSGAMTVSGPTASGPPTITAPILSGALTYESGRDRCHLCCGSRGACKCGYPYFVRS